MLVSGSESGVMVNLPYRLCSVMARFTRLGVLNDAPNRCSLTHTHIPMDSMQIESGCVL